MSRFNQFFKDLLSPLYRLDYAMLARYLNDGEAEYISRLRKAELLHAVRVASIVRDSLPDQLDEPQREAVIKAALLHDVGKYHHAMGPVAKTFMVLFGKRLSRNPDNVKQYNVLDIYLHHAQYSWELVKQLDSFRDHPYLYDLIRYHHEPEGFRQKYGPKEQEIFRIYQKADEES